MVTRTRSEFSTQDEWLAYVDAYVPFSERAHALAAGRTELFKRFYELRNWRFPVEFAMELGRIQDRGDLESSTDLEVLNDQIFADLTGRLFNHGSSNSSAIEGSAARHTRGRVLELRDYITHANPYFKLWTHYQSMVASSTTALNWDEYLVERFGADCGEDVEFAQAMAELDKLLTFFHDSDLALPRFSFERIWFLHFLQPPERMLQARSVLTLLLAEIEACMSA